MKLQQKLVIGMAAFLVTGLALAASSSQATAPVKTATLQQPAAKTRKVSSNQSSQPIQSDKSKQEQQELPLLPGARLVAGEAENEFYILGKNDPMPVKAAASKSAAPADAAQPAVNNKSAANNVNEMTGATWKQFESVTNGEKKTGSSPAVEAVADNDVADIHDAITNKVFDDVSGTEKAGKIKARPVFDKNAFEDAVNDQESENTAAPVSTSSKGHASNRKTVSHKLAAVKRSHAQRVASVHKKTVKISARSKLAKAKTSRQLDIKRMVDSIQVIKHTNMHSRKLTSRKTIPHEAAASSKLKHKVISRKQKHTRVKVAASKKRHVQTASASPVSEIY